MTVSKYKDGLTVRERNRRYRDEKARDVCRDMGCGIPLKVALERRRLSRKQWQMWQKESGENYALADAAILACRDISKACPSKENEQAPCPTPGCGNKANRHRTGQDGSTMWTKCSVCAANIRTGRREAYHRRGLD